MRVVRRYDVIKGATYGIARDFMRKVWAFSASVLIVAGSVGGALPVIMGDSAFATSGSQNIAVSPSALDINGSETKTSQADTSGHNNLKISFDFKAGNLEAGDSLEYGWKLGASGTENPLGTIAGATGNPGAGEEGSKTDIAITDSSATASNFTIYFKNTGANNDKVKINNLKVTGDAVVLTPSSVTVGVGGDYTDLQDAVDNVANGGTINIISDLSISAQVTVNKSVTINGGGHTLYGASGWAGSPSNDSILVVTAGDPTINNLTVDGALTSGVQGIQVWQASATLNNITARNNKKAGIHINSSSTAIIDSVITSNNGANYGGITVTSSTATITGQSHHSENTNRTGRKMEVFRASGTVIDSASQYTAESLAGIRVLKSAPGAPAMTAPASPVITSSANLTWTAPLTSGNKNSADSYLVSINGGTATSVSGLTHPLTGLTDGNYTATVQSVAKSGLLGGTATHNFTVAIPDTEKPEGSATYAGGYENPTTKVRYVKNIEDLSFTVNATDNKGVAWATYRAWNIAQSGVEACGNWNTGALTAHIFAAPLQTNISYTVPGSSIKTCDPSMKWKTGSRYQFIHAAYDAAGNESEKFNSTNQLVEIDKNPPTLSNFKMFVSRNGSSFVESNVVRTGDLVRLEVDATDGAAGMRGVDFGVSAVTGGGAIVGLETTNQNPKATTPVSGDTYRYEFTMPSKYINTHQPVNEDVEGLQVKVRGIDNVGNYGKNSTDTNYLFYKFTADNTAPAVPTNLRWKMDVTGDMKNSGGFVNIYSGTALWQHSDSSDVHHYIYKYWNDIPDSPWKEGHRWTKSNVTSASLPGVFNQGEGVHHFCVVAVDAVGNESACSDTFTIQYDKTEPTVTVDNPTGTVNIAEPFTISGDYQDVNGTILQSGVGRLHLYVSANGHTLADPFIIPNSQLNNITGSYAYTLSQADLDRLANELDLQEGQPFTIKAWVYDKANNWAHTTKSLMSTDTTAPEPPTNLRWLDSDGVVLGEYTNENAVRPTWNATGCETGNCEVVQNDVAYYEYAYKSPDMSEWSSAQNVNDLVDSDRGTIGFKELQAFGAGGPGNGTEGQWKFRVRAVDHADNKSSWIESNPITYDHTPPRINASSIENVIVGAQPIVSGTTDDPNSDVVVTPEGGSSQVISHEDFTDNEDGTYGWSVTLPIVNTPGSQTVNVESTDEAGNSAVDSETHTSPIKASFNVINPSDNGDNNNSGSNNGGNNNTGNPSSPGNSTNPQATGRVAGAATFAAPIAAIPLATGAGTPAVATATPGVLGATTDQDKTPKVASNFADQSKVLGDTTAKQSDSKACYTILGICWYYWIPVVIIIVAIIWWWKYRHDAKAHNTSSRG